MSYWQPPPLPASEFTLHRVVITGMGVVAPNGSNVHEFETALRLGRSGIRFQPRMKELGLACQVAGQPEVDEADIDRTFTSAARRAMNTGMLYVGLAAVECWRDAGFSYDPDVPAPVDCDTGAVIGIALGGIDTISDHLVPAVNKGQAKRMGSILPEQYMTSSVSAFAGGLLGLGGGVSTVSSACASGAEALVQGFAHLQSGQACRMLAGGAEGATIYGWAGFDAMRVCCRDFNDEPERASRPLSCRASGFVPAAGAGVLMLETLESARQRGARIYAEIVGTSTTCGGQRDGGTITAGSPAGMKRCVQMALRSAQLPGSAIDYVNGHLTSTAGDAKEVAVLAEALEVSPESFPWLNATKSMTGHSYGASGAIESIACVIQIRHGFLHPSLNAEDLLPSVAPLEAKIPRQCVETPIKTALKVSFGFGDVNACVIFAKWDT